MLHCRLSEPRASPQLLIKGCFCKFTIIMVLIIRFDSFVIMAELAYFELDFDT